jgi:uncharacterized membrane protein HdeD (DUF308 family)
MQNKAAAGWRDLSSFSRWLGLLTGALGAIAILGPEAAHVAIGRLLGTLLMLGGALGLVVRFGPHRPRAAGAVLTWSLLALAAGGVMAIEPAHGFPSASLLIGLLLAGHGIAASSAALKGRRARDVAFAGLCVAAPILFVTGLVLALGLQPGDRWEGILIGFDLLLFGLYLGLGRAIIGIAESDPVPG